MLQDEATQLACNSFFSRLGARIAALYERAGFEKGSFPRIATEALEEMPPSASLSLWDVSKIALVVGLLPLETNGFAARGFPYVTVFEHQNFRIDLLFWSRGSDEIHQHEFAGAFHVLCGSSVQVTWQFSTEADVDEDVAVGRLEPTASEILRSGDTRLIAPGSRFIHSSNYFGRPSVSVVVRTYDSAPSTRTVYIRPGIRCPDRTFEPTNRARRLLTTLARSGCHSEVSELYAYMIETADATIGAVATLEAMAILPDRRAQDRLISIVRRRYPPLGEALASASEIKARSARISAIAASVSDAELLFFLTLLQSLPCGREVLRHVAERFPGHDPARRIALWISDLGSLRILEMLTPAGLLDAVRLLIPERVPCEKGLDLRPDSECAEDEAVRTTMDELKGHWLLWPLFSGGPKE